MKIEVYSPTIRRKEMDAVLTAMVEDKIGPGEYAQRLLQIAREHLGYDYCLALRSPAIALYLALKALNLEDGQGVIISALSPRYYKRVIEGMRLVPLYGDVLPALPCLGPQTVEAVLARKTEASPRCIVLHHTLGFVPDMSGISGLGLPLIEDCSRSYGTIPAEGEGAAVQAGTLSILGLEEKDMLTGGGGALLYAANRRDASVLRNQADLPPEYGLPDLNAAMAVVQFKEAGRNLEKRKEIAQVYTQSSLRTRHKRFVQAGNTEYNNYAFPLILETGMKDVKAYARRKDIAVENAFEDTLMGAGAVPPALCPDAYSLSLRTALFPLYPRLGASETGKVAKLIVTLP
ncbi:MAG: DegT/DnrJ/EryC1/StrS family aminotransferase [Treponema sp.]|jgi:dTDP-4-amino-4,6-dideoxygalactose transaminase|nr:DegT/DnrJ/EryC1/StrS family aminotransferase [Treponema sp.]